MKPYKWERWNSLWKERNNICVVYLLCTGCYTFLDKKIPCHVKTLKLSETFFLSNVDNATCFTISHNLPNGFYFEDNRFSFPFHYILLYTSSYLNRKHSLYRVVSISKRWKIVIKLPFRKYPIEKMSLTNNSSFITCEFLYIRFQKDRSNAKIISHERIILSKYFICNY